MDVSVVVPTRDRAGEILPTVRSVLTDQECDWEVVVMDQSATTSTEEALRAAALLNHPRLRYHRLSSRGLTRSRNASIPLTAGDVIAFIDDDCVASADWAGAFHRRFSELREAAVVYAGVVAAPELADGWVPEFYPEEEGFIHPRPRQVVRSMGIGANFAVRRSVLPAIGPWDEYLGPGAPLGYGEDTDFGYRALRAGLRVYTSLEPTVTHYGVRRGADVPVLGARYVRGMAVMFLKQARCGDVAMLAPVLRELGTWLGLGTARLVVSGRPSGYRAALAIVRGAVASFGYGVDRGKRVYRPRVFGR